ncbi:MULTISPECIES: GNAT family N-acetyltransferase [Sphingomonas]|jgi:GNAT superfamily N-acetyltransferase|uniref:GCN5 family acetyltransferase n=1 Tax=Sphingomonas hankookensis TaxID=563996 RepID=A0ABR5Y9P0_9SPHN|nr:MULTISPECIES: GNAT family N-acetyltransferase [Sphingomonas]KZE11458.1 GCN5 family acetyltransferase [Sphingomonas hankookensis]PZT92499.1 MAG: GNAT family N-acetyltransferase [Sphingomonas sp.]RSV22224.1 GNAT family N-acetyltransferase [Sphingomonas sp. ABOLH]WCP72145.1 GNAT family N-acetyltransferase [Sphingomonas hankookensis]
MTPTLRDATVADAGLLVTIGTETFTDTFGHLYHPDDLAAFLAKFTVAAWEEELSDPRFHVVLAMAGDDAVGYAKLGPPSLPFEPTGKPIELRQFYLRRQAQGTGLAATLMEHMLAKARATGADELFLSVFIDNHRARRFYERYGFERVGTYAFMVGNHRDEDDVMRVAL